MGRATAEYEKAGEGQRSQRLCVALISKRAGELGNAKNAEERGDELVDVEVLRLDWQKIATIENLDAFTNLRELYLQHNSLRDEIVTKASWGDTLQTSRNLEGLARGNEPLPSWIETIQGMDTLRSLEFLALGSNRINRLENLRHLKQVLDLSHNYIGDFDDQELPNALVILNFAGNACSLDSDFRRNTACALKHLLELDGKSIARGCEGGEDGSHMVRQTNISMPENAKQSLDGTMTLHVTVHSDHGEVNVVPISFSASDDVVQVARLFCVENGLYGEDSQHDLLEEMKGGSRADTSPEKTSQGQHANVNSDKFAVVARQQLHSTEEGTTRGVCKAGGPEGDTIRRFVKVAGGREGEGLSSDGKLNAITNLQRARARIVEESTASFENYKRDILSKTRALVERKSAASRDRADALDEDIRKILDEARSEFRRTRERASARNKEFSTNMRERIEQILAERRRNSELVRVRVLRSQEESPTTSGRLLVTTES